MTEKNGKKGFCVHECKLITRLHVSNVSKECGGLLMVRKNSVYLNWQEYKEGFGEFSKENSGLAKRTCKLEEKERKRKKKKKKQKNKTKQN